MYVYFVIKRKIFFLNYRMNPQPCTKCKSLPEDILMLACNHDLCLECAGERLAFEMKKRKNANVWYYCYVRVLYVSFAMRERLLMRRVLLSLRSWSLRTLFQQGIMLSLQRESNCEKSRKSMSHPLVRSLLIAWKDKRIDIKLLLRSYQNPSMSLTNDLFLPLQFQGRLSLFLLLKKTAQNITTKKYYISVLTVNVSVFVLNVSFMGSIKIMR